MNHSPETASSLEFFKVFLPNSCSQHMSIPPAFLKHLNETFPQKATIKDHTGKSWCVILEKENELVYFKNGWKDFVDYHFLKYGYFLVFKYYERCSFEVKIFGKNGCKKTVVAESVQSAPIVEDVLAETDNSVPTLGTAVKVAGNSHLILKVKEESEIESEKEDLKFLTPSKKKRVQVVSTTAHKPRRISKRGRRRNPSKTVECVALEGPFFERTMKPSSSKTIYLSGCMVRDQNIKLKPNIVLRDEEGKLWPVAVCSTSQNRFSVTTGWSKFYEGQRLRINDKCEFEFVLETGNFCSQLNVKVTRRCLSLR